ncbi:MAG: hypothetical protein MUC28_03290 [Planctomycetes bacterium]|jgi:hypothetical protein|nr:hypothetical protein [Planctomycetota bacterium]
MVNYKTEILKKIETFGHLTMEQKDALKDFALSLGESDWEKFRRHPASFTLKAVRVKKINRELKSLLGGVLSATKKTVKDFVRAKK